MFTVDESRWVSKSGKYAGFQCTECGIWRGADTFLNCKCDITSQFLIAGKEHGEPVYWNIENGWTDDMTEATTFPVGIFGENLPPGAEGIVELTFTGEHVAFYSCTPPPGGGLKNS